jgi:hypothetical protein
MPGNMPEHLVSWCYKEREELLYPFLIYEKTKTGTVKKLDHIT